MLIYISTDYVFPGVPGDAPYEVNATTRPTTLYGQTKLDGENAVLDVAEEMDKVGSVVVLRVPVLYGHAETPAESAINVLMESVWKAQTEGTKILMDDWGVRYPTNTEDVARVCRGMLLTCRVAIAFSTSSCCCGAGVLVKAENQAIQRLHHPAVSIIC